MTPNTPEQQLHERAARGEALTAEERLQLDEWYARLDREEGFALAQAASGTSRAELQGQIEHTLADLALLTQRIQALTAENATLRQEVVGLQRLLAQKQTPQPA
jgi:hypothetical protein